MQSEPGNPSSPSAENNSKAAFSLVTVPNRHTRRLKLLTPPCKHKPAWFLANGYVRSFNRNSPFAILWIQRSQKTAQWKRSPFAKSKKQEWSRKLVDFAFVGRFWSANYSNWNLVILSLFFSFFFPFSLGWCLFGLICHLQRHGVWLETQIPVSFVVVRAFVHSFEWWWTKQANSKQRRRSNFGPTPNRKCLSVTFVL